MTSLVLPGDSTSQDILALPGLVPISNTLVRKKHIGRISHAMNPAAGGTQPIVNHPIIDHAVIDHPIVNDAMIDRRFIERR